MLDVLNVGRREQMGNDVVNKEHIHFTSSKAASSSSPEYLLLVQIVYHYLEKGKLGLGIASTFEILQRVQCVVLECLHHSGDQGPPTFVSSGCPMNVQRGLGQHEPRLGLM